MKLYLTVGLSMLAGAALLEAALIPGLVIGGAAVLLPKYLPKLRPRPRPDSSFPQVLLIVGFVEARMERSEIRDRRAGG